MKANIEYNEVFNSSCQKKCTKEERKVNTSDDLCNQTVSKIDGLPVRCVGEWAMEKIYHLIQYLGIFSSGMKYKWDGKINYIEICSGPGRCIKRNNGLEFNGTSLCVIEHPCMRHLNKALFFDYNPKVVDSLNQRIAGKGVINAKAAFGDYNDPQSICEVIRREIKQNGLNLVFIDPTDCSLPFILVKALKANFKNIDLIINIALGTDYNRNIKQVVQKPESYTETYLKYTQFVDNPNFLNTDVIKKLVNKNDTKGLRLHLREEYVNSLKAIGYRYFEFKHIRSYYDLIFASSHERGIEFWKKATKNKPDGQRTLNF
jgi:three-Cys-motif partner protein